jgi:hypothetical protein
LWQCPGSAKFGTTSLENAISVHAVCHPKGNSAMEFAKKSLADSAYSSTLPL